MCVLQLFIFQQFLISKKCVSLHKTSTYYGTTTYMAR